MDDIEVPEPMQEQLNRIEAKVDTLTVIVNQHVGLIGALKVFVGILSTGIALLLAYFNLPKR